MRLGHEVHLLCQERHPERASRSSTPSATGTAGALRVRELRGAGARAARRAARVYRPDIGELLPVYVADRYEGIEARTFAECSDEEIARYIDANVAAVRERASRCVAPEVALANHLVMGPAILARALAGEVPYAVKVHGSALEYTVKPDPERFLRVRPRGRRRGARRARRLAPHGRRACGRRSAIPQLERAHAARAAGGRRGALRAARAGRGGRRRARARGAAARGRAGAGAARREPASGRRAFARDERAAGDALERLDPATSRSSRSSAS